jgi:Rps23 Pro-64 3,4-dihydroxylase Tpa1-like proline 4-hydroxylase
MRFKQFVWTSPEAIDPKICDHIIELGLSQEKKKAVTKDNLENYRESDIVWLYDPWIMDLVHPFIREANEKAGWNLEYDEVKAIQFTEYNEGGYYDWHRDSFEEPFKDGKIRKLSVTVNLNDDFEGGDMWFDNELEYGQTKPMLNKLGRPKGSVNVFPSHVWHKVDKVTKGTRYSLVIWFKGDPFK